MLLPRASRSSGRRERLTASGSLRLVCPRRASLRSRC